MVLMPLLDIMRNTCWLYWNYS